MPNVRRPSRSELAIQVPLTVPFTALVVLPAFGLFGSEWLAALL